MSVREIYDIDRRNLFMLYNPDVILCLCTALTQQGYTTFNDISPYVFAEVSKPRYSDKVNLIPNIFGNKDIIVKHDRKCTSIERSICECLYWNVQVDVILEALEDYESDNENFESLLQKSKEYGVHSKLEDMLKLLEEDSEE